MPRKSSPCYKRFLCSPNNPTGNNLDAKEIIALLQAFQGIVVIDEAYIDFSSQPSFIGILDVYRHPQRIPQPHHPPNVLESVGMRRYPLRHGIRFARHHRHIHQNQISVQHQPPHPARSPAHDATPLRSATLGKHPVRRTRAPDGTMRKPSTIT